MYRTCLGFLFLRDFENLYEKRTEADPPIFSTHEHKCQEYKYWNVNVNHCTLHLQEYLLCIYVLKYIKF